MRNVAKGELPNQDIEELEDKPVLVDESFILFLQVGMDEFAENPLEVFDGCGRIYGFHPDLPASEHYKPQHLNLSETMDDLEEDFGRFVLLGYFEHGPGCRIWHLTEETPRGTEGDYRFDGTRFAGFWVPDEAVEEDLSEKELKERAREACEVLNSYFRGDVWYYRLTLYEALRSSEGKTKVIKDSYVEEAPEWEDSCGGYYGGEALRDGVTNALLSLKEYLKTKESEKARK